MASLDSVRSKLDRAYEHLDCLGNEVATYLKSNPTRFVADPNSAFERDGTTWVSGSFESADALSPRFALILGDTLNNLRSCLDYLVWELVLAEGKDPSNKNAFPICDTVESFGGELQRGRLNGVHSAVVSHIESSQPYHAGKKSHETILWLLHEFTNVNKHRRVLIAKLNTVTPPDDFEVEQLADGTTVAKVNPPVFKTSAKAGPFRVIENEVEMDGNLMAYVVLDEAPVKGFEIVSFMTLIHYCPN
jgi:hypothetical protein